MSWKHRTNAVQTTISVNKPHSKTIKQGRTLLNVLKSKLVPVFFKRHVARRSAVDRRVSRIVSGSRISSRVGAYEDHVAQIIFLLKPSGIQDI